MNDVRRGWSERAEPIWKPRESGEVCDDDGAVGPVQQSRNRSGAVVSARTLDAGYLVIITYKFKG